MPFQSEKQRRYLWANEPEIARDWADTYGSRIEKNDGGIMRTGFFTAGLAGGDNISPGTSSSGGMRHGRGGTDNTVADELNRKKARRDLALRTAKDKEPDVKTQPSFLNEAKQKLIANFVKRNKYKNLKLAGVYGKPKFKGLWGEVLSSLNPDDEVENFDVDSIREIASRFGGDLTKTQVKGLGGFRKDLAFQEQYKNPTQKEFENYYGLNNSPIRGNQALPNYYAPRDVHPGTGDDTTIDYDFNRDFQDSLTSAATTPDYYAGDNPLASNIAWGKQFGADPRTMGLTSYAANGGRIPAAFGGIMDTATGRRAYGFGSIGKIFGKVAKAAKKVFKSPVGKAAIMYGLGAMGGSYGLTGSMFSRGMFNPMNMKAGLFGASNAMKGMRNKAAIKGLFGKLGLTQGYGGLMPSAQGWIGAATALPWLMPGPEEDDEGDKGSNYDVLRNKYASELMNIKRGVRAGSLDPNEFSYLPSDYTYTGAEGGRAGYYAGGQSIPSEYTMEDAMMTTTQDKLGGITDVMKQADQYRQGDIGQFYAAQGGRIGFADGMNEKLAELKKAYDTYTKGGGTLSFDKFSAAFAEENFAQGGRIGAEEGGLMDLGGMEKDYRNDGGFVPLGGEEKADDVPARLSKNEFVFTADAVRGAGGGDIDKGAEIMENIMNNLEQGGQISEETQGLSGAQEMFDVSERLSEVV